MPTVHNLHQPLFGYRPCTASHSLRRHDQRRDRLDSDLLLVPLASDSLIEVSLDPLAPRLANAYTIGARRAQLVHASRPAAQRVHQRQLLLHHLQQLSELQEPEAGFMLAVGLDFGKQSRSQLRLPLAQPQGFVTSGHNASDATARQPSRANAKRKTSPRQAPTARPRIVSYTTTSRQEDAPTHAPHPAPRSSPPASPAIRSSQDHRPPRRPTDENRLLSATALSYTRLFMCLPDFRLAGPS